MEIVYFYLHSTTKQSSTSAVHKWQRDVAGALRQDIVCFLHVLLQYNLYLSISKVACQLG